MKRFWSIFLVCILVVSCTTLPASAMECTDNPPIISRVAGRLDASISAKEFVTLGNEFSLDTGDIIKYDCTYTPKSASVDFGYVAPDGLFYSINSTAGSIDKSMRVNQHGMFILAIRNNAMYTITVTGIVKY